MSVTDDLNGIDGDRQALLRSRLSDAAAIEALNGPWKAQISWDGGFRTTANARGHRIAFDEPADLTIDEAAASPHEYLLAALGSCLVAGVVLHASVRGIQLNAIDVDVSGTFDNILRWAGMSDSGNPGYRAIEVHGYISAEADDQTIQEIWEQAVAGSPVGQTVSRPTPVLAMLSIEEPPSRKNGSR